MGAAACWVGDQRGIVTIDKPPPPPLIHFNPHGNVWTGLFSSLNVTESFPSTETFQQTEVTPAGENSLLAQK